VSRCSEPGVEAAFNAAITAQSGPLDFGEG
jgi:hypothetical protein